MPQLKVRHPNNGKVYEVDSARLDLYTRRGFTIVTAATESVPATEPEPAEESDTVAYSRAELLQQAVPSLTYAQAWEIDALGIRDVHALTLADDDTLVAAGGDAVLAKVREVYPQPQELHVSDSEATVEGDAPEIVEIPAPSQLHRLSAKRLREIAGAVGIEGAETASKDDLVEVLSTARSAPQAVNAAGDES